MINKIFEHLTKSHNAIPNKEVTKTYLTKYKNSHILTISKKYIYFLKVGDNMLYDYLVNNYEKGEPIFLMDIVVKGI